MRLKKIGLERQIRAMGFRNIDDLRKALHSKKELTLEDLENIDIPEMEIDDIDLPEIDFSEMDSMFEDLQKDLDSLDFDLDFKFLNEEEEEE